MTHPTRPAAALAVALVSILAMSTLSGAALGADGPEGGAGARSGGFVYEWTGPYNVTVDGNYQFPAMAFDSHENLHMVFTQQDDNLTYLVMSPDLGVLKGPVNIATTSAGWIYRPGIAIDSHDNVYITYLVTTNASPSASYHPLIRIDSFMGDISQLANLHGGDVLVDGNDDLYTLEQYSVLGGAGGGVPDYGNTTLVKMDRDGNELWERKVGYNFMGTHKADIALCPGGDVLVTYMMNDTTLNLSRVRGDGTVIVDEANYTFPEGSMLDLSVVADAEGRAHIFYSHQPVVYWPSNRTIHQLIIDGQGLLLSDIVQFSYVDPDLGDIEAVGPDPDGVILVYNIGYSQGSGGGETGSGYYSMFVDAAGNRLKGSIGENEEVIWTCPGYGAFPAMNHSGAFHIASETRKCYSNGQGPGPPPDHINDIILFHTTMNPNRTVDLEVPPDGIVVLDGPVQDEPFEIRAQVRNMGDYGTGRFRTELSFTDNRTVIDVREGSGLPKGMSLNVTFNISLTAPANLSVHAVPMYDTDVNLSNNWANFTVVPVARPDVRIAKEGVLVLPARKRVGDTVEIRVPVENRGGMDATMNMTLLPLIEATFPLAVAAGGMAWVNTSWTPGAVGNYNLTAALVNITPAEPHGMEADNTAIIDIPVVANVPPSIDIATPSNGSVVRGPVTINGTFSDPDLDQVSLSLMVDGTRVQASPAIDGSNFSFIHDLTGANPGTHEFEVVGCDGRDCGNDTINVIIEAPPQNRAPHISSWGPSNRTATLGCEANVTLTVTVGDPDGDRLTVEWWLDGRLSRAGPDVGPLDTTISFTFERQGTATGGHNLTMVVSDGNLNATLSFEIIVLDDAGCGGQASPPPTSDRPGISVEDVPWPLLFLVAVIIMTSFALAVGLFLGRRSRRTRITPGRRGTRSGLHRRRSRR